MPLLRPRVRRTDKQTNGYVLAAKAAGDDSTLQAIAKWIPMEVVTFYKAAMGIIPGDEHSIRFHTTWLSVVATVLWIAFATRPKEGPVAWRQVIIAPIAFTCWAVATQQDVVMQVYPEWKTWMAALVVATGTLLLPIIDGLLKAIGVPQGSVTPQQGKPSAS